MAADQHASVIANIRWWDADADNYQREHGEFLGLADFLWCPENVREADAQLLGAVDGKQILEVGCGAASCSRWLQQQGAYPVGVDLSTGMLRHARAGNAQLSMTFPLVQADVCALPFHDESFDTAFSAFGAIPFVANSAGAMQEVFRVLRPGGRWVFSVTHPMRWMFADAPPPEGLIAIQSYFDRSPYVEVDAGGVPAYAEHHRTMSDRIRELLAAGFRLDDVIEPEWPDGLTNVWGQWTPERGAMFPGTVIFVSTKPA